MPQPDWNTPFYEERDRRTGRRVMQNMLPSAALPPQMRSQQNMVPQAALPQYGVQIGQFLGETQGSPDGIPLWLRDQLTAERAMNATDRAIQAYQALEPQQPEVDPFTLSAGQTRFGPKGEPIASMPAHLPTMTPYQQERLNMERQKAEREPAMTPYQQATLGLRKQALERQQSGQMTPEQARAAFAQIKSLAQSIKSDYFGEDPRTDQSIEQIMESIAQEMQTSMADISQAMLGKPATVAPMEPPPRGLPSAAERVPLSPEQEAVLAPAKKAAGVAFGGKVVVRDQTGKKFWLPAEQLSEAIRQGYQQVQ